MKALSNNSYDNSARGKAVSTAIKNFANTDRKLLTHGQRHRQMYGRLG